MTWEGRSGDLPQRFCSARSPDRRRGRFGRETLTQRFCSARSPDRCRRGFGWETLTQRSCEGPLAAMRRQQYLLEA